MIKINHHEQRYELMKTLVEEQNMGESMQISQNNDSTLAVSIISKRNKVARTHFIDTKGEKRTMYGAGNNRHAA